jgi:hypothetical protein
MVHPPEAIHLAPHQVDQFYAEGSELITMTADVWDVGITTGG